MNDSFEVCRASLPFDSLSSTEIPPTPDQNRARGREITPWRLAARNDPSTLTKKSKQRPLCARAEERERKPEIAPRFRLSWPSAAW